MIELDKFISTLPETFVSPEIKVFCSDEIKFLIIDNISKKVRDQYEENPYPRWRFARQVKKLSFTEVINTLIKPNKIDYNENFENPDVLIAGCGTGKDPISANIFKNANILAVDSVALLEKLAESCFKANILAVASVAPVSYTHLTLPTNREV